MLLRYNGSAWSKMTYLAEGYSAYYGVWGTSAANVFAVGYYGAIIRYNGSAWSSITCGTRRDLFDICNVSGTDVFAVGEYGTVVRYQGGGWSQMTSNTTNDLKGVWGSSSANVFAVGGYQDNIFHYDGTGWSPMISPEGEYSLYDIWGISGSNVFAVGQFGTIVHYDGNAWSLMTSNTMVDLYGIWESANDVFVVGSDENNNSSIILHYDGSGWSIMTIPDGEYRLYGVWGSSGSDVFAVGNYHDNDTGSFYGIILHYDGSTWTQMTIGALVDRLYGVWGSSANDVFAVGDNGTIMHYNGSTWSAMASGTTNIFFAVGGSSAGNVFVAGRVGAILHYGEGKFPTVCTVTTTIPPNVIELTSFTAQPLNKKIQLEWITASEIDNAGFNLYRSESENGEYEKINTSLFPAQGSSTQGASYEFIDGNVKNRKTYWYKLEDIDLNGTSTMHGPVSAMPRLIYRIGKR